MSVSLILHAHLPLGQIDDPSDPAVVWFFEAMAGSYLPLVRVLRDLDAANVPGKLTVSVSPPLVEMMRSPRFQAGFFEFLDRQRDVIRQANASDELRAAVHALLEHLEMVWVLWDELDGDVVGALRDLDRSGRIELGICSGMHGILPLVIHEEVRRLHVESAVTCFRDAFGHAPRFMWLPECGYAPGVEKILAEAGLWCAVVEAQAISEASSRPVYGNYGPLMASNVAFFGRDETSGRSVWSAEAGFPGDAAYREFHRELAPGLKPWRVTGSEPKQPWDRDAALQRARDHASQFVEERLDQLRIAEDRIGRQPHVTAAYDAELFGHWWFEGPEFLRAVFEHAARRSLALSTPTHYLETVRVHQRATPAPSTWGRDANFSWWVDPSTLWIYPETGAAEARWVEARRETVDAPTLRAAGRELMLAQCSDWPFAIRGVTYAEYAKRRIREHLENFWSLLG